jgi:hypothetical protein
MAERATRLRRETLAVVMALACLTVSHSGVTAQKGGAPEVKLEAFDRNNFDTSTQIDNEWLPLQPGMQLIYEGFTREEHTRIPRRVVQTVTDLTKFVNGVRAVVVCDVDYQHGELQESEIAFFAQDKDGSVWQLGELVEIYEEGDFVGAHAWSAGMEGASAGIMMKADPHPGTPSYSQGYAPAPINWSDRAKVDQVGQKSGVPAGYYKDVLVIAESSTKEGPVAQQLNTTRLALATSGSAGKANGKNCARRWRCAKSSSSPPTRWRRRASRLWASRSAPISTVAHRPPNTRKTEQAEAMSNEPTVF